MIKTILPVLLFAAPVFGQSQLQVLDGQGDFFGSDVDILATSAGDLADVMIVGDFAASQVRFYERDADGFDWQEVQVATSLAGVGFGLSVELDRSFLNTLNYAIIGAPDLNPRAEILVRDGFTGLWSTQGTITPPAGTTTNDLFGASVDVDFNGPVPLAFVAAPNANDVFIYSFDGISWGLDQTLTSPNAQFGGNFGQEISYDDDFLLVGAPGEANGDGRVYAYRNAFSGWLLEQTIDAPDTQQIAEFGISLDVEDELAAIGASNAFGEGRAYVLRKEFPFGSPVWVVEQTLVSSDIQNDDLFGRRVDVAIDRVIVGAPGAEDPIFGPAYDHGAAYVFSFDNGVWTEDYRLRGPESTIPNVTQEDGFGFGATIDAQFAAVGRPRAAGTDGEVDIFAANDLIKSQTTIDRIVGGSQQLFGTFDPADIGDTYFLVGSLDPLLTPDGYTNFTLSNPNSPFFMNSLGVLSIPTVASSVNIPAGINFVGTLHHAFILIDATTGAITIDTDILSLSIF